MKVEFWWCTHDTQSMVKEVEEIDDDTTDADLDGMAEDSFWNDKQPEWGWEKLDVPKTEVYSDGK